MDKILMKLYEDYKDSNNNDEAAIEVENLSSFEQVLDILGDWGIERTVAIAVDGFLTAEAVLVINSLIAMGED